MIRTLVHAMWRILIFGIGLLAAWFLIFKIRPYANAELPNFVVIVLLWCCFAYVLIPLLIRIFRLLIKPDHIPIYAATPDGWPSDPVNIALIVQNKTALRSAMKRAGWHEADRLTIATAFREVLAILFNLPYVKAPVGTLMLFNRGQDIAFQIPTNRRNSPRTRHHVRFWKLDAPVIGKDLGGSHTSFWKEQLKKFAGPRRSIWIGAATEDTHPIAFRWRSGQLTHGVSKDDAKERDFLIQTLKETMQCKKISETTRGESFTFRGQSFRTRYVTDGSLKVVELKKPLFAPSKKAPTQIATSTTE